MLIKPVDLIILLLALGLIFFSFYAAYFTPQGNTQVLIQGQSEKWIFQIDGEETLNVSGPIGDTVVRLSQGSAWVESSPCVNKTCVATGFVSRQGQWAACLPNNVLLMINKTQSEDVDAISW